MNCVNPSPHPFPLYFVPFLPVLCSFNLFCLALNFSGVVTGSHAVAVGSNPFRANPGRLGVKSSLSPPVTLDARGVGNNPNPISLMGRIDGTSWNDKCLGVIPFGFHFSKHLFECHTDDASNILA